MFWIGVVRVSEADKMFEELGYEIENENGFILYNKISEINDEYKAIVFNVSKGLIDIRTDDNLNLQVITTVLNMQELKAINKKVEELGWNEWRRKRSYWRSKKTNWRST